MKTQGGMSIIFLTLIREVNFKKDNGSIDQSIRGFNMGLRVIAEDIQLSISMGDGHTLVNPVNSHQNIIRSVIPESSHFITLSRVVIIGVSFHIGKIAPVYQHLQLIGAPGIGNKIICSFKVPRRGRRSRCGSGGTYRSRGVSGCGGNGWYRSNSVSG